MTEQAPPDKILEYQRGTAGTPFNRRNLLAAAFCATSIILLVLLYLCKLYWLVRPSTVERVEIAWLVSIVAAIAAAVRLRRHAVIGRGHWLAIVAAVLALCSCLGGLPLFGPASEGVYFRFEYANRDHFGKIAEACRDYAGRHSLYPEHLAVLVAEGAIATEDLLDPFSRTKKATLPAGIGAGDWRKVQALIDAHCDYVYIGAGLPDATVEPDVILLYDKPIAQRNGRLIRELFGDRFVSDADLSARFAADEALRKQRGWPVPTYH